MTYGTIRFIEQGELKRFLAVGHAALRDALSANLNVVHSDAGREKGGAEDFRRIIDRTIEFGGSFYLTYHRWANAGQVETCYPQFVDFLRLKRKYDPRQRFQSDWIRMTRRCSPQAMK